MRKKYVFSPEEEIFIAADLSGRDHHQFIVGIVSRPLLDDLRDLSRGHREELSQETGA